MKIFFTIYNSVVIGTELDWSCEPSFAGALDSRFFLSYAVGKGLGICYDDLLFKIRFPVSLLLLCDWRPKVNHLSNYCPVSLSLCSMHQVFGKLVAFPYMETVLSIEQCLPLLRL